ncbi:hypothetical protein DXG01_002739 [Tephrocybe rancida]|nr:hypothetical protein DXG01_002739 [Tephrocybe rancida]
MKNKDGAAPERHNTERSKETDKPRKDPPLDLPFERVPALNHTPYGSSAPSYGKREPLVKTLVTKLLEAEVTLSANELLEVASDVRKELIRKLDKKPGSQETGTIMMTAEDTEINTATAINVNDLPVATYFIADGGTDGLPKGAAVHKDCVATYLEGLPPGEKPTVVYVARDLQVLRSLFPQVNKKDKVEAILDSGSQIVCMSLDVAVALGLKWDPDIRLRMESANQQVNESAGLARNVPFTFTDGFTVYLQVHIFVKPAYSILLGRPFDTLTESNIQNLRDGSAIITIRDPNTGKRTALATWERGKTHEGGQDTELGDEAKFPPSRN